MLGVWLVEQVAMARQKKAATTTPRKARKPSQEKKASKPPKKRVMSDKARQSMERRHNPASLPNEQELKLLREYPGITYLPGKYSSSSKSKNKPPCLRFQWITASTNKQKSRTFPLYRAHWMCIAKFTNTMPREKQL